MSRIGNNLDPGYFLKHRLDTEVQTKKQIASPALQGFGQLAEALRRQHGHRLVSAESFKVAPSPSPADQAAQKIQEDFKNRFAELAADPEKFHSMMKEVYGPNYNRAAAEAFRQKALAGDFSWLPKIEFQSEETLQGAYGAYDASRNVVYLNEKFKNDPKKAVETYSEEVGAFLDTQLNTSDTIGDEGEMFRRLLHGERLTAEQKAEIRADDDRGVIYVNGKATEVEFFWKTVKKALNWVGGKIYDAGKAVVDHVKENWPGILVGAGLWALGKGLGKKPSIPQPPPL